MMYQRCTEICQMADFYGLMLKKESGDMAIHTFAAIYIGTYDVSLKVFEFLDRKKIHQVDHIRSRLDLGQDAFSKGSIGYEHVEELCDTLAQFKEIMQSYRVDSYEVYASAVLRDAENELFVLDQIYLRTGFKVKVRAIPNTALSVISRLPEEIRLKR